MEYRSVNDSLEASAKQIRESLQGFRKERPVQPKPVEQPEVQTIQQPIPQPKPLPITPDNPPAPRPEAFEDKFRRWMLILLTILIGGLAIGAIIWRILARVL